MTEFDVVSKSSKMMTQKLIEHDLKKLGVCSGETLLVHSSLSSIGWVCGGAVTVINALLEIIGNSGTIVMPSFSGDNSDPAMWQNPPVPKEWWEDIYKNMPAFNAAITPTRGLGVIAELFRTIPGSLRSNHPNCSFSANGALADIITKNHPLTPSLGMESPLGFLYKINARVLMLGTTFETCSSFHLSETLIDGYKKIKSGAAMFVDGKRKWVSFEEFDEDTSSFVSVGEKFKKEGKIVTGNIGMAKCFLFNIKEAVDFAVKNLHCK